MKKLTLLSLLTSVVIFFPSLIHAQGVMGNIDNRQTAQDETDGKNIYNKLLSKQITCQALTDDDFDVLGDYFMGQRLGNTATHAVMNNMMTKMMGEEGEKQVHVSLGKWLSGCDPTGINGWKGGENRMMGYGGWDGFGGLFMAAFWVLIIFGIVALFRNMRVHRYESKEHTPLEILKTRYAKGEIDKKEFESIKKDLV